MSSSSSRFAAKACRFILFVFFALLPLSAQVALQSGAPDFGTQTVGQSATATFTYVFASPVTIATPQVLTQGYSSLDFTMAGGTCVAGTYASNDTCTLTLSFTPAYPGLRMGAVVLSDLGGTPLATTYIQGSGSGALPAIPPVATSAGISFRPMGIAVDAAGYIYVADVGALWRISPDFVGVVPVATGLTSAVAAAVDGAGAIYIADPGANCVWKVAGGQMTKVNAPADLYPVSVAVDGAGNLYISDSTTETILQVAPDGSQTTVASQFAYVGPIAMDAAGSLYVGDNHPCNAFPGCISAGYVWKVTRGAARTKVWTGISGGGSVLSSATGIAVDGAGSVYIVDSFGNIVVLLSGGTQMLLDPGISSWSPRKIAVDGAGNAYVTDITNNAIVKLGGASSFKSNGICGASNGGAFQSAPTDSLCSSGFPSSVSLSSKTWSWSCSGANGGSTASCSANVAAGLKFTTAPNPTVRAGANAGIVVVAILDASGSAVTGSSASVSLSVTGPNAYSQDYATNAVNGYASFNLSATPLNTAGSYTYSASSAGLLSITATQTVIAGQHSQTGIMSTLAGNGNAGYNGDGFPATWAQVNYPGQAAVNSYGNVFIADTNNYRIRVICTVNSGPFCADKTAGYIYTVAGNGNRGYYNFTVRPATSTPLGVMMNVAIDSAGNLYLGDWAASALYKVDAVTQKISWVGGGNYDVCPGATDTSGNGCPATRALLFQRQISLHSFSGGGVFGPSSLAVDALGNIFIADSGVGQIRVICGSGGGPYCGGRTPGYIYSVVSTTYPTALVVDAANNIYYTEYSLVHKVDANTKAVSVVAGGGNSHCSAVIDNFGDGCLATEVMIYANGIALDSLNDLYLTDGYSGAFDFGLVREVDANTQIVSTVAGSWLAALCSYQTDSVGDGCPATSARLSAPPSAVVLDAMDNLYITDQRTNRIRKSTTWTPTPSFSGLSSQTVNYGLPVTLSGSLTASGLLPGDGETVTITINGTPVLANLSGGNFSISFDTLTLPAVTASYTVTYDYAGNNFLTSATASTTLTVQRKALKITANSVAKTYGDTLTFAGTEFTYIGLADGDSVTGVTLSSTGADPSAPVGTYDIVPSAAVGNGLDTYTITYINGTLTVNSLPQTITFPNPGAQTYPVSPIVLTAGASSGLPVSYSVSGPASISGSTLYINGAGLVTVTATQPGDGNTLAAPPVSVSFTVNPFISPSAGSSLSDSTVTFAWDAGKTANSYMLYLGTGIGLNDIYDSGRTTATSATVSVPTAGQTIYARLFWRVNALWTNIDFTYTETGSPSAAEMISPVPSGVLPDSPVTFNWSPGSGVAAYQLLLGTTGAGSSNLFVSGVIKATSVAVPYIPADAQTVYARLFSKINGVWSFLDYTYTESGTPAPAAMQSPTPGTALSGASVTFTWNSGVGVSGGYQLLVGTTGAGSSDLFRSGTIAATSALVNGIPVSAFPVYVRLLSKIGGAWQSVDYTYTEAGTPTPAAMQSPTPGTKLGTTDVVFTWNQGVGVNGGYQLIAGTNGAGSSNLYSSGIIAATTATIPTLPGNAVPVYVRLFSKINGVWSFIDYLYTEAGTITAAEMLTPAPGSVLGTTAVQFTWTPGVGINGGYQLQVGTSGKGAVNLYNSGVITSTTATVPSIPATGKPVYVRLFSRSNGVWQYHDYIYTAQ